MWTNSVCLFQLLYPRMYTSTYEYILYYFIQWLWYFQDQRVPLAPTKNRKFWLLNQYKNKPTPTRLVVRQLRNVKFVGGNAWIEPNNKLRRFWRWRTSCFYPVPTYIRSHMYVRCIYILLLVYDLAFGGLLI